MGRTTAFYTDQYELTALRAALHSGVAYRPAVFEVFARSLPEGRRYGVFCGLGRLIEDLADFRFGAAELEFLVDRGVADTGLTEYLDGWRFGGDIHAYVEGETYFPYSPVLRVEATFAEACLIETLILSIVNHDSAIASAATRMVSAARGRPLIEMGSRRTHEQAALAVARAAYIAGFAATSNLAAGRRYGVPTVGTSMHAFTLAHDSELDAFRAQIAGLGPGTTLLVDTYDVEEGVRNAVQAARESGVPGPGAVRIDSGVLRDESRRVRALLDQLGAPTTRITATSDLDEYAIDELADDPVDSYGVGTRLVSGSGAPTAGFVYKLVAITDGAGAMRPVAKRSAAKVSIGGRKTPYRLLEDRTAVGEYFSLNDAVPAGARPLQRTVMLDGIVTMDTPLACLSNHRARSLAELPDGAMSIQAGDPTFVATLAEGAVELHLQGGVMSDDDTDQSLSEEEYLRRYATRRANYPRAEHTVDIALFTIRDGQLALLLIRRGQHPERGKWALPGGFLDLGRSGDYGQGETLEDAARRELAEETGLELFPNHLEQLRTYGDPWRDKRGRIISTAYVALMANLPAPVGGDDAADAHFFAVADLSGEDGPELAFDHSQIISDALARVRGKIEYEGRLAASFLSGPFTIPELRRVYEAVWGGRVHRGDFRRKVLSTQDFLVPTGDQEMATGGPPAPLYHLGHATELHPPMLRQSMLMDKEPEDPEG